MKPVIIKPHPAAMQAQIALSIAVLFIGAVVLQFIYHSFLHWAPHAKHLLSLITWLSLIGIGFVSVAVQWAYWQALEYRITDSGVVVKGKRGLFGTSSTDYRFESIISVDRDQDMLGALLHYGSIRFSMPKLQQDVVFRCIAEPDKYLDIVRERMQKVPHSTSALIN